MNITRHEELRLPAHVEADIAGLLAECFPTDFGGRSYFQNRHHARFCLYEGDRLAGHLAVLYRAMRLGERRFDAIGLAEVAVHPDFRRRGIAAALVQAALTEARDARAHAAVLFGTAPLYARAGFRTVPNVTTLVNMHAAQTQSVVTEPATHLMAHPLGDFVWDDTAPLDLGGFKF